MTSFQAVHSDAHIADVVCLAHEIWPEYYGPIIGQKQVDYMLEKFQSEKAVAAQLAQFYEYYVIFRNGQSAGYLAVVPHHGEASLMISKIYLKKAERGHGVGRQMLQFVEKLCLNRRFTTIWLTVNKRNVHAIAWYSSMGFRNIGALVLDIGGGFVMDDFRMEKVIDLPKH